MRANEACTLSLEPSLDRGLATHQAGLPLARLMRVIALSIQNIRVSTGLISALSLSRWSSPYTRLSMILPLTSLKFFLEACELMD